MGWLNTKASGRKRKDEGKNEALVRGKENREEEERENKTTYC